MNKRKIDNNTQQTSKRSKEEKKPQKKSEIRFENTVTISDENGLSTKPVRTSVTTDPRYHKHKTRTKNHTSLITSEDDSEKIETKIAAMAIINRQRKLDEEKTNRFCVNLNTQAKIEEHWKTKSDEIRKILDKIYSEIQITDRNIQKFSMDLEHAKNSERILPEEQRRLNEFRDYVQQLPPYIQQLKEHPQVGKNLQDFEEKLKNGIKKLNEGHKKIEILENDSKNIASHMRNLDKARAYLKTILEKNSEFEKKLKDLRIMVRHCSFIHNLENPVTLD